MKKLSLAIFVFLAFQSIASAEAIIGKVLAVDLENSKLTVSYMTPEGTETQSDISVKPETLYTGLASFAELEEGEEVVIDAAEDPASGELNAVSIAVSEVPAELPAQEEVQAAAEKAAPAL